MRRPLSLSLVPSSPRPMIQKLSHVTLFVNNREPKPGPMFDEEAAHRARIASYFTAINEICSSPGNASSFRGVRSTGAICATVVRAGGVSGKYCA